MMTIQFYLTLIRISGKHILLKNNTIALHMMALYSMKIAILYNMANRSLYRHAPNWFPTRLALQDTGIQHTTWQYSDLLAILYLTNTISYV